MEINLLYFLVPPSLTTLMLFFEPALSVVFEPPASLPLHSQVLYDEEINYIVEIPLMNDGVNLIHPIS